MIPDLYRNSQLKSTVGAVHAFIYDSLGKGLFGQMRDLAPSAQLQLWHVHHGKNTVVGYSTTDKYDNRIHAFLLDDSGRCATSARLWQNNEKRSGFALGVNGVDEVVVYTYLPSELGMKDRGRWPYLYERRDGEPE